MAEAPPFLHSALHSSAPTSEPGVAGPPPGGKPTSLLRRCATWLPATAVVACVGVALGFYGVSAADLAVFSLYIALGVALPGLLWVRVLYRGTPTLTEGLALGVTLGYALEVLTYIPARALGVPLLVLAWPISTYVLFLAVPRLRRHWRGAPDADRTPLWWSWCTALIMMYLIVWSAVNVFRTQALTWPAIGTSFIDMPFHLALAGELKNHMPPMVPTVAGESLVYHWFVYAHVAAASWVTGVEPLVLLFRLAILPMLAALVVILGMIGRRITHSNMGALAGLASTLLIAAPSLYLGEASGLLTWKTVQSWSSPTQTFGALFFAPIVLLLIDLLGHKPQPRGRWVLLGIMLVAVMGAKAIYLPLLMAGLAAVVLVEAVKWFALPRRPLAALGLTAACLLFAQCVLFGGARQGLLIDPLSIMRLTLRSMTGLEVGGEFSPAVTIGAALLCVLCGVITWCGIFGLVGRPHLLVRPVVVLVLSMSAAGLAAALVFGHPHQSQGYFLQASYPYLAMVAVYGLMLIVRKARVRFWAMACAAGVGVVAVYAIRTLCGVRIPLDPGQDEIILFLPYVALLGVVLLAVVVLRAARQSGLRTCALVICMVTAAGTPAAWFARVMPGTFRSPVAAAQNPNGVAAGHNAPVSPEAIPEGAFTAGRWLRAHSAADDLVATNVHCRTGFENPCDSREFWATALSERRMLVEGWAYTVTNMDNWRPGEVVETRPFWDRDRLLANDVVFQAPSAEAVRRLRDVYGVRWLFVDESRMSPGADLGPFADLQLRAGDYAVYRLPPTGQ
ncbi:hypothetical protein [Nonomuraea guangzhouensis]|uniref:Uncharacterized protein n=1 Tax=Nonomuraea guangzhouensis TaxID=1291555 RepID=A0ABW4FZZ9_9ACTN|nr:hypothetical protein [Nonomuraea guangzhouensis]